MNAPEWLSTRGGQLEFMSDRATCLVLLNGTPQYKLIATPADGKHSCAVMQTVNGKRSDPKEIFATEAEALRGGLESLRAKLGW